MLVDFECFHTVQIAHACLRRIFQCGRVYLHFTYNDIYICYNDYRLIDDCFHKTLEIYVSSSFSKKKKLVLKETETSIF